MGLGYACSVHFVAAYKAGRCEIVMTQRALLWRMSEQQCDAVHEYYDRNTGQCSRCDDACYDHLLQTEFCSANCAGQYIHGGT